MLDITNLISGLARERPVFHSEADFQHSLAWYIHETIPNTGVRLEFRPPRSDAMYLDIWLPRIGVALELKYLTRELKARHQCEYFELRNHSAAPTRRYDFLNDIQRLENVQILPKFRAGFAILLTNDRTYWNPPTRHDTVDREFRIHEGRRVNGTMTWSERTSAGTKRGRNSPIILNGAYDIHWRDYAETGDGRHRRFRYLTVKTSCRGPVRGKSRE